jgi:hypothetical protein
LLNFMFQVPTMGFDSPVFMGNPGIIASRNHASDHHASEPCWALTLGL